MPSQGSLVRRPAPSTPPPLGPPPPPPAATHLLAVPEGDGGQGGGGAPWGRRQHLHLELAVGGVRGDAQVGHLGSGEGGAPGQAGKEITQAGLKGTRGLRMSAWLSRGVRPGTRQQVAGSPPSRPALTVRCCSRLHGEISGRNSSGLSYRCSTLQGGPGRGAEQGSMRQLWGRRRNRAGQGGAGQGRGRRSGQKRQSRAGQGKKLRAEAPEQDRAGEGF